jgi:hypothetical protein
MGFDDPWSLGKPQVDPSCFNVADSRDGPPTPSSAPDGVQTPGEQSADRTCLQVPFSLEGGSFYTGEFLLFIE